MQQAYKTSHFHGKQQELKERDTVRLAITVLDHVVRTR